MKVFNIVFTLLLIVFFNSVIYAQENIQHIINTYLETNHEKLSLSENDIKDWVITDQNVSKKHQITHVYIRQQHEGIPISNGVANMAIKNGKVITFGNRFIANAGKFSNTKTPSLNPSKAIVFAAKQLQISTPNNLRVVDAINSKQFIYNGGEISKENIPVQLMYYAVTEKDVRLVWDLSIYTKDAAHWWSVQIDAQTGELIAKNDWVVHCGMNSSLCTKSHAHIDEENFTATEPLQNVIKKAGEQYGVIQLPSESPNHGSQSVVVDPADLIASPFGWHDTNGAVGAEFTTTRGNNVHAYEDADDDNLPGFSPDGGATLDFVFPFNPADAPALYQPAAITNLFYMSNMMHDIWYQYGFDEVSGNFQSNNYGKGGVEGDYVFAEAQDGGGTNNANFASPPDGSNPRMQMYLWTSGGTSGNFLDVNTPIAIAGSYSASEATFGPGLPTTPITEDVVLVIDDTAPVNDACETITNGAALVGKIAMIDRGTCQFVLKVEAAQNAGAVAVIIVNNAAGTIQMGGTSGAITIPSIMISQADGNLIKAEMASGTVNATISNGGVVSDMKDGDMDNGIIAHEYGHGISIRLTGGGANSNCLGNAEQMGEGWSDWFGLMLTIEPGDLSTDVRGVGTYSINESTTGVGIRPAPYSTDFGVNPYTYGDSNNSGQISQPHGVGFIFATVLWDLTWALINQYGGTPDADLYTGTGGNNIAMHLIIEGLKLQPCNPGMIDGRDAILLADQLLYGGAHQCLIWNTFANRGFGYSASQGSSASRTDQIEAFDLPPSCTTATVAPNANFTASSLTSCNTNIDFTDNSTDVPQSWFWDFGDGQTDTLQNPTHYYASGGTYTVQLMVSNTVGSDSTTQTITITPPSAPLVTDVEVCPQDSAYINATATGEVRWTDTTNSIIFTGNTLVVPNTGNVQTFYVQNVESNPSQYVGPVDGSIGAGTYHASAYHGALNFSADKQFELVSAWVDADSGGPRTFFLASGINSDGAAPGAGQIVDQVTINLVAGPQRVNLNLMVPSAGDYNIGGNNVNLFRNNDGVTFPYTLPGYMTINNSSASTDPTGYYYYLYDFEVRDSVCISPFDTVTVTPIESSFTYVNNEDTVEFTDTSINATDWFWDFGDGNTSILQNPVHVYALPGNYTVTLEINGGECSSSDNINLIFVGVEENVNGPLQMALSPNPSNKETKLIFNKNLLEAAAVSIYSMEGKMVKTLEIAAQTKEVLIPLNDMAPQIYLVVIKHSKGEVRKKLVVQ